MRKRSKKNVQNFWEFFLEIVGQRAADVAVRAAGKSRPWANGEKNATSPIKMGLRRKANVQERKEKSPTKNLQNVGEKYKGPMEKLEKLANGNLSNGGRGAGLPVKKKS